MTKSTQPKNKKKLVSAVDQLGHDLVTGQYVRMNTVNPVELFEQFERWVDSPSTPQKPKPSRQRDDTEDRPSC